MLSLMHNNRRNIYSYIARPSGIFQVALLFILPISLFGQSISGKIVDSHNHPVKGALLTLTVDKKSTTSDDKGSFLIQDVSEEKQELIIRCLGYKTKTIPVEASAKLNIRITLEDSIFSLDPFTLELNRHEDLLSKSTLVMVQVKEEDIVENPAGNLMNTLEGVAGVNSINTGVGVGKPVIRGLSQNRVLVAESGIKQEGQQWGNDHGLEIDQFDIEELEIIKGASSLEFGSDALGGVVLVPRPKHMAEGDFQHSARGIYKSNNELYGYVLRSKGSEKGLIYRVNLSNQYYGDYMVPANEFTYNNYVLPIYNGRLKNTGGKELHYSLNLGTHFRNGYSEFKVSGFNQKVGLFPGAIGLPRAYNLQDDNNSRNIELPYQNVQHEKYYWHTTFSNEKGGMYQFDLGWQRNTRREHSAPHSHGRPIDFTNDLAHELILNTYSLNGKYILPGKKKLKNTIGIQTSYLNNEISGFEFIIPPYTQLNGGLYYVVDFAINDKTQFQGGLRVDVSQFQVTASNLDFLLPREVHRDDPTK